MHIERMSYVVGAPQRLHCQQLFKVLELMGLSWASKCENVMFGHIAFGDESMSTRKGNIVFLTDVIEKAMEHWDLTRVVLIDKLIMQIAVAEFFHLKDIPPKVTLNEAVNLAKKFSQEDSGKFVNGVLDRISHGQKLFEEGPDGQSGG